MTDPAFPPLDPPQAPTDSPEAPAPPRLPNAAKGALWAPKDPPEISKPPKAPKVARGPRGALWAPQEPAAPALVPDVPPAVGGREVSQDPPAQTVVPDVPQALPAPAGPPDPAPAVEVTPQDPLAPPIAPIAPIAPDLPPDTLWAAPVASEAAAIEAATPVEPPAEREAVRPRVGIVIGAGAVGSFLGATLATAGWDITLVGRRGGGDGTPTPIVVEGPGSRRQTPTLRRVASSEAGPESPDLIIAAVKMYDLPGALETASRWPDVPLMTVQNGIGAEELAAATRTSALLAGSLTTAVESTPDGVVRRRTGGLGIAPVRGDVAALCHELLGEFADGGLPTADCRDAASMKWSKLLANLVGNATSGLLNMDPGTIWGNRFGFDLERRQLQEALAVMHAMQLDVVSLPGGQVGALLFGLRFPPSIARPVLSFAIGRARGGKHPSLRMRLRGGGTGPTEVPWLNGAVAEAGARLGVPTPVNATLAVLVERAADGSAAGDPWLLRPDLLLEAALAHG